MHEQATFAEVPLKSIKEEDKPIEMTHSSGQFVFDKAEHLKHDSRYKQDKLRDWWRKKRHKSKYKRKVFFPNEKK